MTVDNETGALDLSHAEYLLDPPDTIWEGILSMDHATWLEVKDLEVIEQAEDRVRQYSTDLTREAWLGLYASSNPLMRTPPAGMEIPHSIFSRAASMPEWGSLRKSIVADEIAAAFGAAHFSDELIHRLPPEVKETLAAAQAAQEALHELRARRQLQDMIMSPRGGAAEADGDGGDQTPSTSPGTSPSITSTSVESLVEQLLEAEAAASECAQDALRAIDKASARIDRAMAESASAAATSLSGLKSAAQEFGFGWSLGGNIRPTWEQVEGLHELADYLKRSEHLKLILDALGWAKRMVSAERRKSRYGRESFTHYQVQELDLESIAPEELVGWMEADRDSPLWLDFLRRALDGELLHRRYEGEDEVGRGPFVMLIDKSGSMHGRPNATACAVELALMKLALEQNRRFISIPFSDVGEFHVFDPGPRPDPSELLRHLELFYGNGTEPYGPLTKAIELIRTDPAFLEGDVLIITDGAFDDPDESFLELLAEAREEPGLKVVAVLVRGASGQAVFADKVVPIHDLVQERDRLAEAVAPLL
jgi:uncharacterized protein with von Willebrand factor type A (vWA) domain